MQFATTCRAHVVPCRPGSARRASAPTSSRAVPCTAAPRRQRQLRTAAAAVQADTKYPAWDEIFRDLTGKHGTRSVAPEEAFDMVELGQALLVDVRPREDFDKGHAKGAVCVPAFLVINAPSSPGEWAKWVACKANGVVPTKPNAALPAEIAAAAGEGKAVILACEAGGTLQPSINFAQGKVSRSLKAVWKVVSTGSLPSDRVMHLEGGVYGWFKSGMPMLGDYDGTGAGRTPSVAERPTGSFIDGK